MLGNPELSNNASGEESNANYDAWQSLAVKQENAQQQLNDDLLNIDDMLRSGRINEEQAEHFREEVKAKAEAASKVELTEEASKQLEDDLLNIDDMLSSGRINEEQAEHFREEVKAKAEAASLGKQAIESEESSKLEEEQGDDSQLEKRIKEIDEMITKGTIGDNEAVKEILKAKDEEEEKKKLEEEEKKKQEATPDEPTAPLVAINADFSIDKRNLAQQEAETALNKETTEAKGVKGFVTKLWKGTLFKKYFQKKYERELLEGTRKVGEGEDAKTVDEIVEERSGSALERFRLGITENMDYIHEEIGKQSKNGEYKDGEKIEDADAKTQEFVKGQIEQFVAKYKNYEGETADLRLKFDEQFKRAMAEARDNGQEIDVDGITNYGNVALQALELSIHGASMDKIMEGFKVINAKVNDEIRTETHRDAIDKIINAVESSKIGQVIPAEVIALAVGTTASLAQMGARSAASAVAPAVGGILVSSAISGLRERNRITEDRAHMMRDIANGLEYKEGENKSKRQEKYEKRIGGTLYDLRKASELTDGIRAAIEAEDSNDKSENILRALAEARVRRDLSDSEQKDLIAFGSAGKRGEERLALDQALIRGEKTLSDADREKYEQIKAEIQRQIMEGYTNDDGEHIAGVTEQDKKFANRRALMATAKAGKTLAIGAVTFFASQEIMAAIDPNKIGIFEKAGLLKTSNNTEANETLIASGFGLNRGTFNRIIGRDTVSVSGDDTQTMQDLSNRGYTGTMVNKPYVTTKTSVIEVDPSKSNLGWKYAIDGWANNGTKVSDGNELRMYLQNGFVVSGMKGQSTMGNQSFDIASLTQADRIKAFVTLGGQKFELVQTGAGQWGNGNGVVDLIGPNGALGSATIIGKNGEKLYEELQFVVDNGPGADGARHVVSLATDHAGASDAIGKITQTISETIEHPATFEFSKTIFENATRGITGAGIAFAPDTARQGLGVATARDEQKEQAPPEFRPPEPQPPVNTIEWGQTGQGQPQNNQPVNRVSTGGASGDSAPIAQPANTGEQTQNSVENGNDISLEEQKDLVSDLINGFSDEIGGEEGVRILTQEGAPSNEDFVRYRRWWDSLSPEGKNRVGEIILAANKVNANLVDQNAEPLSFGNGFRDWHRLNANVMPTSYGNPDNPYNGAES